MGVASLSIDAYDLGWNDFIGDPRLRALVAQALRNNRDLRVTTLNIEKARALYRIQDAQRLPTVDAVASATRTRTSGFTTTDYGISASVPGYELDLFGRVRDLSDAALSSTSRRARTGVARRWCWWPASLPHG